MGDARSAAEDFSLALQANPTNADAFMGRAYARNTLRDVVGAIADMQRAAELFTSQGESARAQEALDAARGLAD